MGETNLSIQNPKNIILEDYTQSANSLFHFMKRKEFLENALLNKALFPRFCKENIEYLNLQLGQQPFCEVAILQKCFCDIPLHMVVKNFEIDTAEDYDKTLTENEKRELLLNNNHPGYYGNYALAFSKKWCENKNLQPVHYLNSESSYTRDFKTLLDNALNADDLSNEYVVDVLQRLSLIKPLRGKMKRRLGNNHTEIEVFKNFHDEQEWRYVPDIEKISCFNKGNSYNIEPVIANPIRLNREISPGKTDIDYQSDEFGKPIHKFLWLRFEYQDIRYMIVPDKQARLDMIEYIMDLPKENFNDKESDKQEKYVLISKLLLLDEIRKDW